MPASSFSQPNSWAQLIKSPNPFLEPCGVTAANTANTPHSSAYEYKQQHRHAVEWYTSNTVKTDAWA